jgi:predicted nucleic acid-binding protein
MTVLLDLNVVLDVVQRRTPHYRASALALSRVARGEVEGVLPSHAITTLYYIVAKYADRTRADDTVDWMLGHFNIASAHKEVFVRARSLDFSDFEDAVTAVLADQAGCDYLVTRNIKDFGEAPIEVVTPLQFLGL